MHRLSRQQQRMLIHLYRIYQEADSPERDVDGVYWGVTGGAVKQASVSRSLRRLETRGLILRQHHAAGRERLTATHRRTTHVRLLPAGLALAQRLIHASDGGS
jgi:hypothetical protein